MLNIGHVTTKQAKEEDKSSFLSQSHDHSTSSQSRSCDTGDSAAQDDRHDVALSMAKSHDSCHDITTVSHDPRFILVGLHTCGDLAPTILRAFTQSGCVVGVASVGCCYMKLTDEGSRVLGYPMSEYGRRLGCGLSYEAREVACHSNEMYREKLQGMIIVTAAHTHTHTHTPHTHTHTHMLHTHTHTHTQMPHTHTHTHTQDDRHDVALSMYVMAKLHDSCHDITMPTHAHTHTSHIHNTYTHAHTNLYTCVHYRFIRSPKGALPQSCCGSNAQKGIFKRIQWNLTIPCLASPERSEKKPSED